MNGIEGSPGRSSGEEDVVNKNNVSIRDIDIVTRGRDFTLLGMIVAKGSHVQVVRLEIGLLNCTDLFGNRLGKRNATLPNAKYLNRRASLVTLYDLIG